MILNPPHIIRLLRAHRSVLAWDQPQDAYILTLGGLFLFYLHRLSWPQFLATYHLYLQSIPLDDAKAAWGLTTLPVFPKPTPAK